MPFEIERLDDTEALAETDRSGMLRALATAGAQVRRAVTATREAGLLERDPDDRPRAVLVAAMGADNLVGDLVCALAARHSPVGVWTAHDLPLPGWVGSLDLVVAVSLSGRAPGPLRLAHEAGRRGATVLSIGAPDSPLAEATARARGVHIAVEREAAGVRLASRSAAWSMLTPVVLALAAHGLVDVSPDDLAQVADRLDAVAEAARPGSESFVSPPKILAGEIAGRLPMILGDGPLTAVAARRVGTMLARTARIPVMVGELPDAAAELLACLDGPYAAGAATGPDGGRDIFADPFLDGPPAPEVGLLLVRDRDPRAGEEGSAVRASGAAAYREPNAPIGPQDAARINLTQAIVDLALARGTRVHELTPGPGPDIVRLAELIAQIDFAATYLALGHGLDPAAAPAVADLRDLTS
ncbi:SIS domain-containing protein [Nostocoides australiense]